MPRLRRNPFMSLWLSAAHRIAGTVRGTAIAAARRQQRAALAALAGAANPKPPRRRGKG